MKQDFLWGGALAANQCEGAYNIDGKGLSISDVMLSGSKDKRRKKLLKLKMINIIQVMRLLIFIILTKRISSILKKWDLIVYEFQLPGVGSFQMVMKKSLMKLVCNFMMIYLMSY